MVIKQITKLEDSLRNSLKGDMLSFSLTTRWAKDLFAFVLNNTHRHSETDLTSSTTDRERKRDLTCFSTTRRERERISVFHNRHRQTDRKSVCAWVKIAHIPSPSLSKRLKASLNSEIWSVESWSAMSTPTQIFSEFVQKRREGEEEMSVCM